MQDKIMKFEKLLESELEKEMDRIIAAKTINSSDVKTVMDAVCLMLKVKEYEEWENEGNSFNSYDDYSNNYSMRRGRSQTTGRYVSRDGEPMRRSYGSYDNGYSGHDMRSRMLDKLEGLYKEAHDPADMDMLDEWIGRLASSR